MSTAPIKFSEIVNNLKRDINAVNSKGEGSYELLFRMTIDAALKKHKNQPSKNNGYFIPENEELTLTVKDKSVNIIVDKAFFIRSRIQMRSAIPFF